MYENIYLSVSYDFFQNLMGLGKSRCSGTTQGCFHPPTLSYFWLV